MSYQQMMDALAQVSYEQAKEYQSVVLQSKEHIDTIEKHSGTVVYKYPDFKESFDYVDSLFPQVKVKEISILQAQRRLLKKLGYGNVGGYYNQALKAIVICNRPKSVSGGKAKFAIIAKMERDEVLVHELLHYCSVLCGNINSSSDIEEEFAYGWSIGYLRSRGHSDDDIIENTMMPWLAATVNQNKVIHMVLQNKNMTDEEFQAMNLEKRQKWVKRNERAIYNTTVQIANERGVELIRIFSSKMDISGDDGDDDELTRLDLIEL